MCPHAVWQSGFNTVSPVDTLLGKEDVTLIELLDEDDLIQECKSLNNKLVDFLAKGENVQKLVDYIVVEPPADAGDELKYK
eukprot:SAG22_NODE_4407_length_1279_cov_22.813559_2_plen_81_part_00